MTPSWELLNIMGRQSIVKAVKVRRESQIVAFCRPQKDQFSTGFVINKIDDTEITEIEKKEIKAIEKLILNCGVSEYKTLDKEGNVVTKTRKGSFRKLFKVLTDYSLTYDHAPFEIVRNRKGEPMYWHTLDALTIKQADSFIEERYTGSREQKDGKYPKWVQIINEIEHACFYEDECEVIIRNPQENIYNYGYGRSELEDLLSVVADIINALKHNSKAFSEILGDRIINIKGEESRGRLQEFRQLVRATLMGAANSHGSLVTAHEKGMEMIKLSENNKDMEYSQWIRICVGILCSLYVMAPEEINWESIKLSSAGLGEKSNEKLLKMSRDIGLRPLLEAFEDSFNHQILPYLYGGKYEICFAGLNAETQEEYQKRVGERLKTDTTINEIRAEQNKKPLPYGDVILDQAFLQWVQFNITQQQQQPDEEGEVNNEQEDDDLNFSDKVDDAYKALDSENLYQVMVSNYLNKIEDEQIH